jgi:hypothetical protein
MEEIMKLEKYNWNYNTSKIQPTLGELVECSNDHEDRISAIEAKINSANEDLKRALMDADNAIQKAIAHFRRTDGENVK